MATQTNLPFSWDQVDGSGRIGGSYYPFQDQGTYIYSLKKPGSAIEVRIDEFDPAGIYKLSTVTILLLRLPI